MLRIAPRFLGRAASAAFALTVIGCVQRPAMVIETSTGDVIPLETWSATLSGALHGTVTLAPGATHREALATINLAGATPGARHAWFVQLGECTRERGVLGGLRPYTPLAADEEGTVAASIALPFTVPTEGEYSVTVLQSELVNSSSVACGNLTKDHAAIPTIAEGAPR